MKFSCYCHQDDESMYTIVFSFAEYQNIIYVEMIHLSYALGNLEEETCKFFLNKDELQLITKLYEFYQLSLHLTKNNKNLVYNDSVYNTWGIRCRKHRVGKCFTDEYYDNYGFSEHPSVIFDKILKKKKSSLFKYNQYSIKYYKEIYDKDKAFQSYNYLDLYYNYEMNKIEKELGLLEEEVHKEIMQSNVNIIREVLPEDIVDNIKFILGV